MDWCLLRQCRILWNSGNKTISENGLYPQFFRCQRQDDQTCAQVPVQDAVNLGQSVGAVEL